MQRTRGFGRALVVPGLVMMVLALAACGSSSSSNSSAGGSGATASASSSNTSGLTKINFGLASVNMLYAPYIVGEAAGIFKQNHLALNVVLTKDATTAETAVATGSTPIGAITTDAIAIAHHAQPGVAIMQPVVSGTPYALMTPKSISSPQGLKGKAIAASALRTADGAIVTTMLDYYHLVADKDYTILIAGDPAARTQSLLNGRTAGLAAPEPEISLLESKGFKPLINAAQIPGLANRPFNMIATTRSYAQAHPQTIVNFEKAWLQSVNYMYNPANKTAVIADLSKALATPTAIMTTAYQDWMVKEKPFPTTCDTSTAGLNDSIQGDKASGNLTGPAPTPASLLLGGNYCSQASAG